MALVSSKLLHGPGLMAELVEAFIAAGAAVDGVTGSDGWPLGTALKWGYTGAVSALLKAGAVADNVVFAAGANDTMYLDSCFNEDGSLTAAATAFAPHFCRYPPEELVTRALTTAA